MWPACDLWCSLMCMWPACKYDAMWFDGHVISNVCVYQYIFISYRMVSCYVDVSACCVVLYSKDPCPALVQVPLLWRSERRVSRVCVHVCTCMRECRQYHKSTVSLLPSYQQHKHTHGDPRLQDVTVRVLELFVRHVCILRPLGEGGKMRITTDMAQVHSCSIRIMVDTLIIYMLLTSSLQIELALAPFCSKLAELGRPYKMLRALRWGLA